MYLAIIIGFVPVGNAEAIATGNSWKLGNITKELVVGPSQENDKQACGSASGVFTMNISYVENNRVNNGGEILECWLDMQLPKTIVSKSTRLNFEKYVKKAYLEVSVNNAWIPMESSGLFDRDWIRWEWNGLNIPTFGPPDSVNRLCSNYKEKSTYQTRAVVILKKPAKKLYSKPFTVSYGNHPQEWLQTCPKGTSSTSGSATPSVPQGERACTGIEAYNLNTIKYRILLEMRFASTGYQAEVAKLRSQGILIEDSCDIDSFDPVKMKQKSIQCTIQTKSLLLEVQSTFNILNDQYIENLKSQKELVDKINFAGSSGKSQDKTRYQLQYDKVLQDVQWIYSMRENTIATFKALDSTCANSGITEPKI